MMENSIRKRCHVNTNFETDTFVGICCADNKISVNFPVGYHLPEDDALLRKDIVLLLSVLTSATKQRDSKISRVSDKLTMSGMPIQSFLYIIADFYNRGYYREKETIFCTSNQGKVDWNKTIKRQKPYLQDGNAYYLNFTVRKARNKENELIALIHECCVYESFRKLGWLFTNAMPKKPRIKFNQKLFYSVVREKLAYTFEDKNKKLFYHMLAVINSINDPDAPLNYEVGTNRFEYVWETMIDSVFGIDDKEQYFPETEWLLPDKSYKNADLEPDSILLAGNDVYVLDSKYYKYGATKVPAHLPKSTSINKQITYGEYIAEQEKFREMHGKHFEIYNAFIMPFDAKSGVWNSAGNMISVGEAVSKWKSNEKTYERIQGVLIDVRHVMTLYAHRDRSEVLDLAELIEKSYSEHTHPRSDNE